MAESNTERGLRRTLTGRVVSTKMDKTVVVLVARRFKHPTYKKYVTRTKKYLVHDETNTCREGDDVLIVESKPISARKRLRVRSVQRRAILPDGLEG